MGLLSLLRKLKKVCVMSECACLGQQLSSRREPGGMLVLKKGAPVLRLEETRARTV